MQKVLHRVAPEKRQALAALQDKRIKAIRKAVYMRVCQRCGAQFKESAPHQKFCTGKCRINYYNDRAKQKRAERAVKTDRRTTCLVCGDVFVPRKKKQQYCSKACQYGAAVKSEKVFKREFEDRYPGHEYISGYNGWRSFFRSRCKLCGLIVIRSAQCIKPTTGDSLNCSGCITQREMRNKLIRILRKGVLQAKKQIQRETRENELKDRECKECGKRYDADRLVRQYCSEVCAKRHGYRMREIIRRTKMRENGTINWDITLRKLYDRDGGKCHICGEAVDMDADTNGDTYGSIDHVIPVSKGGTHTWDNVKLAHRICNSIKSDSVT